MYNPFSYDEYLHECIYLHIVPRRAERGAGWAGECGRIRDSDERFYTIRHDNHIYIIMYRSIIFVRGAVARIERSVAFGLLGVISLLNVYFLTVRFLDL